MQILFSTGKKKKKNGTEEFKNFHFIGNLIWTGTTFKMFLTVATKLNMHSPASRHPPKGSQAFPWQTWLCSAPGRNGKVPDGLGALLAFLKYFEICSRRLTSSGNIPTRLWLSYFNFVWMSDWTWFEYNWSPLYLLHRNKLFFLVAINMVFCL